MSEFSDKRIPKSVNRKLCLYSNIIKALTGHETSNFISVKEEDGNKIWSINENYIQQFKQERKDIFQSQISELNFKISHLEQELEQIKQSSSGKIKELEKELNKFKSISIRNKNISNIKTENEHRASFFSQYLEKRIPMIKSEKIEQMDIETNLIENCFENIRKIFDELPKGINPIDNQLIKVEINPYLEICLDSRVRISYLMDESEFVIFLKRHISELECILRLFNEGKDLIIPLTSYEKRLIFCDSYLSCYERPSEIQQRALINRRLNPTLEPFSEICLHNIPSYLLFIQPEEAIKISMITSDPINSIIFIPQTSKENSSDLSSFYILQDINGNSKSWKLDHHAFHISGIFRHQYLQNASRIFRKFYQDIFGDNKYKPFFWKILSDRRVERWNQMKILLENIRIVSEEYLLGKLVRHILIKHASHVPDPETDTIISSSQTISVKSEFNEAEEKWKKGIPATDSEPEEWLNLCFDSYKLWRSEHTDEDRRNRWSVAFSIFRKY